MAFSDYIASLMPRYEVIKLKDNLHSNVSEINEHILPAYKQASELFESSPFRNKEVIDYSKDFTEKLTRTGLEHKHIKDANVVQYVTAILGNVVSIEPYLKERIVKDCGRTVIADGITFNRQFLLQFIEAIDFFCYYSKTLLNWITALEFAEVEESRQKVLSIGPDDAKYLQDKMFVFAYVSRIIGTPLAKLRSDYGDIPDMVIDPDSIGELTAAFGEKRLDPQGFSGVPFPISLALHGGMFIANWQMDQYDDTVAQMEAVNLRILMYKKKVAENGGSDAALEKMLDIQEDRYMVLKQERERLERKYGLK